MNDLEDYKKLWNFKDPEATAFSFEELMEESLSRGDKEYYLIVKTQLARTYSLRLEIEKAKSILEEVNEELIDKLNLPAIHYNLEMGRCFNSGKEPEKSQSYFRKAIDLAKEANEIALEVDALHMMGIASSTPEEQIKWNRIAIDKVENSDNALVKGWLGPLYNNTAWSLFDQNKVNEAKELFEKDYAYRLENNKIEQSLIALWSVARMERALGNLDRAMDLQLEIKSKRKMNTLDEDGYNFEELGEISLKNRQESEAAKYFSKAYELLSEDVWFKKNEKERLDRIKSLSGQK